MVIHTGKPFDPSALERIMVKCPGCQRVLDMPLPQWVPGVTDVLEPKVDG